MKKINEAVWGQFVAARAKNMPISGPILEEFKKIKLGIILQKVNDFTDDA